jgi:dolichyl-phosphate-mannose--protein O-mannosyl transferase
VGPLVILLFALTARLWGIGWQLPSALYFDELKYVGWAGDAKDDANAEVKDLRNPTFFHHLLQAEYAVAALAQRDATPQQRAVFELWLARVTSAVLGALACLATALATSALVRAAGGLSRGAAAGAARQDAAWSGLAAGLILALAPLHVHLAHYAVNDATASLFLALTLMFGCRALTGAGRRDLLVAGVAAGLAFSTKYSFAVGLLLPLIAAALTDRYPAASPAAPRTDPHPSLPLAGGGFGRGSPSSRGLG